MYTHITGTGCMYLLVRYRHILYNMIYLPSIHKVHAKTIHLVYMQHMQISTHNIKLCTILHILQVQCVPPHTICLHNYLVYTLIRHNIYSIKLCKVPVYIPVCIIIIKYIPQQRLVFWTWVGLKSLLIINLPQVTCSSSRSLLLKTKCSSKT